MNDDRRCSYEYMPDEDGAVYTCGDEGFKELNGFVYCKKHFEDYMPNENKEELAVVVEGNLSEGFSVTGPFVSFDAAVEYNELSGGTGWVMVLESPLKGE